MGKGEVGKGLKKSGRRVAGLRQGQENGRGKAGEWQGKGWGQDDSMQTQGQCGRGKAGWKAKGCAEAMREGGKRAAVRADSRQHCKARDEHEEV